MVVPGIVTNITNFGAFVDIGVKQDGLVHISQMSNTYISDPNEVVKLNMKVTVTVTEVDVARKRISLSMKDSSKAGNKSSGGGERRAGTGGGVPQKSQPKKAEPLNPFQAKLAELKKKFND